MYTWDGRWIEEDDYDPPVLRRHCNTCGAFLPKQPQEQRRMVPSNWEYEFDSNGEMSGIRVLAEELEIEEIWTCKRCGRIFYGDEMYQ